MRQRPLHPQGLGLRRRQRLPGQLGRNQLHQGQVSTALHFSPKVLNFLQDVFGNIYIPLITPPNHSEIILIFDF